MLKFGEYVPYAPYETGVVRINHDSPTCKGDSKSMRIERKEDGTITAICFRCGNYGVHSSTKTVRDIKAVCSSVGEGERRDVGEVGTVITHLYDWPIKPLHWIRQYGITDKEISAYQIAYSETQRRVILPIWWQGEKVGYQLRRIYDDDKGPKYITRTTGGPGFMSFGCIPTDKIVIVEDIISAIKVGRHEQALALMSTSITQRMKLVLSKYGMFYIWLDMDNEQVISNAIKLLKTLGIFGTTKLLYTPNDPKEYDDTTIKGFLYVT